MINSFFLPKATLMKEKDSRAKLMNEILNGIKILKLYAWEPAFFERVAGLRNIELAVLKKEAYVLAVMVLSFTIAPFLVALAAFTVYVLTGNTLDANTAFVSLSIFNILRLPMAWLPLLISYTTMFIVSLKRLNKFFRCDELDRNAVTNLDEGSGEHGKSIQNGYTFSGCWERSTEIVAKQTP